MGKNSLYPRDALDQMLREVHVITDQIEPMMIQKVTNSQSTPKEVMEEDLHMEAQHCIIEMNRFSHQKKHGGGTDIDGSEFLKLEPTHCCFMAPYGSTCLGTMCKMKSMYT